MEVLFFTFIIHCVSKEQSENLEKWTILKRAQIRSKYTATPRGVVYIYPKPDLSVYFLGRTVSIFVIKPDPVFNCASVLCNRDEHEARSDPVPGYIFRIQIQIRF